MSLQADHLLHRDIQNMEDIATSTIGVTYSGGTSSGIQGTVTIRGLSSNYIQDRFQNVGIYLDGIYLQRQSMLNIGMVDLARVELIKGPQNALYGRNAFAGAINYVTEKPSEELEGYIQTTQGGNDRHDYRVAVSGPLVKDRLYGRFAWGISDYDGANRNPHPFADADVPGFNNDGNLGGWDDETYSAALRFTPVDGLEMDLSYYRTEIQREFQSNYTINGLQEIAALGISQYDDMNSSERTLVVMGRGPPQTFTGHTLWEGKLPTSVGPGRYVGFLPPFVPPPPDQAIPGAVEPRGYGSVADTELYNFKLGWAINDNWDLRYQYGYIEHDSLTSGPAARDPLLGSTYTDVRVSTVVTPPPPGVFPPIPTVTTTTTPVNIQSSDFSSRPVSFMDQHSHELRLAWTGDRFAVSLGAYYAQTDDDQYDLTVFAPVCSNRDLDGNGSAADEMANCSLRIPVEPRGAGEAPAVPSPLADAELVTLRFFDDYWNGNRSNDSEFEDEIIAVFSKLNYNVNEELRLRLELRYTEEDREIRRLADNFALAPGQTVVFPAPPGAPPFVSDTVFASTILVLEDQKTFTYFTPRISADWSWRDNSLLYAYAAKGVKSGGFNNTISQEDLTYDQEENWTFEIGSKNILFDNRLTFNAAVFYIDWKDLQGALSPAVQSANANIVTGNIGDATSYGFEFESIFRMGAGWSVDLAYAWVKPEYDNDTHFDAARRFYYYNCNIPVLTVVQGAPPPLCGDSDVGGNQLARASKNQVIAGLGYSRQWFGGWSVSGRFWGSYQSKQYLTPLNVGYLGGHTLYNGNVNITSPKGHWDFTFWGKNLTDKEYVQSHFIVPLFNRMLVAVGQGRSWGATIRYNFQGTPEQVRPCLRRHSRPRAGIQDKKRPAEPSV